MNFSPRTPPERARHLAWQLLILLFLGLFSARSFAMFERLREIYYIDSFMHLFKSLLVYAYLHDGYGWGVFFQSIYPPLVYLVGYPFYQLGGLSLETAFWSQLPFWVILTFSLYGIGAYLFSPLVGVLSALFYLASPMLLLTAPCYLLDVPASAMIAWSFYLLLKAQGFQNRFYSLAFGLILGLGMMVKWWVGYNLFFLLLGYAIYLYFSYLRGWLYRIAGAAIGLGGLLLLLSLRWHNLDFGIYNLKVLQVIWLFNLLIGALIWSCLRFLSLIAEKQCQTRKEQKAAFLNLLDAGLLTYLACGWLYFSPYFAVFQGYYLNYLSPQQGAAGASLFSWLINFWHNLRVSTLEIIRVDGYPLCWLFTFIGLGFYLTKARSRKLPLLLPAAFLGAMLLVSMTDIKGGRYFLGWLVFAAPLSVFWIAYLGKGKILTALVVGAACLLTMFSGWLLPEAEIRRHPLLLFCLGGAHSPLLEGKNTGQLEKFDPEKAEIYVKLLPNLAPKRVIPMMDQVFHRSFNFQFQAFEQNKEAFSYSIFLPRWKQKKQESASRPLFWFQIDGGINRARLAELMAESAPRLSKTDLNGFLTPLAEAGNNLILAGFSFNHRALRSRNLTLGISGAPRWEQAEFLLCWMNGDDEKLNYQKFLRKYTGRPEIQGQKLVLLKELLLPDGGGKIQLCKIVQTRKNQIIFSSRVKQAHNIEEFIDCFPNTGGPVLLLDLPPGFSKLFNSRLRNNCPQKAHPWAAQYLVTRSGNRESQKIINQRLFGWELPYSKNRKQILVLMAVYRSGQEVFQLYKIKKFRTIGIPW